MRFRNENTGATINPPRFSSPSRVCFSPHFYLAGSHFSNRKSLVYRLTRYTKRDSGSVYQFDHIFEPSPRLVCEKVSFFGVHSPL